MNRCLFTRGPVLFFISIFVFFLYSFSLLQTLVDPSWNKTVAWLSHLAGGVEIIGFGYGITYLVKMLERINHRQPFGKNLWVALSLMLTGWMTPGAIGWLIASADASHSLGFH